MCISNQELLSFVYVSFFRVAVTINLIVLLFSCQLLIYWIGQCSKLLTVHHLYGEYDIIRDCDRTKCIKDSFSIDFHLRLAFATIWWFDLIVFWFMYLYVYVCWVCSVYLCGVFMKKKSSAGTSFYLARLFGVELLKFGDKFWIFMIHFLLSLSVSPVPSFLHFRS